MRELRRVGGCEDAYVITADHPDGYPGRCPWLCRSVSVHMPAAEAEDFQRVQR